MRSRWWWWWGWSEFGGFNDEIFLSSSPAKLRHFLHVHANAFDLTELASHFLTLTKKLGKVIPVSFDREWFGETVDGHFGCWTSDTFQKTSLNAFENEIDMKKDMSKTFC